MFKGREEEEVAGRTLKKIPSGEEIVLSNLRHWQWKFQLKLVRVQDFTC